MWPRPKWWLTDSPCRIRRGCTTVRSGFWIPDAGHSCGVDPADGKSNVVARFPGYTRGLALSGNLAFVGLSKIRETSTFGGVPIAEHPERLKCGVGIVDLQRGVLVGQFEFKIGVDEVFDVSLIPGKRLAAIRGPFSLEDGEQTIWTVPQPDSPLCRESKQAEENPPFPTRIGNSHA